MLLYNKQKKGKKAIAKIVGIDPKTVRSIIETDGRNSQVSPRKDRIEIPSELIASVYKDCDRYGQRTYEILTKDHGYSISYPTLMRRIEELGLSSSKKNKRPAVDGEHFYNKPGKEVQHDTSPYVLTIGGRKTQVIASGIYFRFSKIRYIQFYLSFDRFTMKCFLYEAFTTLGYVAENCIIDNTSLARLRGSGKNMVVVPEMEEFAKRFGGFQWIAHEIGHSNRKAGKERNFRSVVENFFPGREFHSLTDLNEKARHWCFEIMARRPQQKTKIIPADAFEQEKPYLYKLPPGVPPPYRVHERTVDNYGYVQVQANFYRIPQVKRNEKLKIIEYPKEIHVYRGSQFLIQYALKPQDVRNEKVFPPGYSGKHFEPKSIKRDSAEEEKKLKNFGPEVNRYLEWALSKEGYIKQRHRFIRQLYQLCRQLGPELTQKTLSRALEYRVNDIHTLERIATRIFNTQTQLPLPEINTDEGYTKRETYMKGRLSDEPELAEWKNHVELHSNEEEDSNES